MPLITALVAHPRRPGRVDVLVDGRSMGAVPADAVSRIPLHVGDEFEPLRTAFEAERSLLSVWDRATGLLAARARSRVELQRLLVRRGEPAALVRPVVDRLERAGYLDDREFARQFARTKAFGTGMSRRRVLQELARRGVAREIAEAAVTEVFVEEGVDQTAAAERLARKKLAALALLDPLTRRRRLYAFLARRGFESEEIREVMQRLGEAD